jgi:hypothetical protein
MNGAPGYVEDGAAEEGGRSLPQTITHPNGDNAAVRMGHPAMNGARTIQKIEEKR